MRRAQIAVLLALSMESCSQRQRQEKEEAERRRVEQDIQAAITAIAAAQRDQAAATASAPTVDPAIAKADRSWNAFDGVRGAEFRTLAVLRAHWIQAQQGIEFLPEAERRGVEEHNEREFRRRAPKLLVPGVEGVAEGEDLTIVIPSIKADRCEELAKAWARPGAQREQLKSMGYKQIACGEQRWKL